MSTLSRVIAKYAQMVSPNGEGFQGFWVITPADGQPIHNRPFKTLREAKAVAMLENAAVTILENVQNAEALEDALNIIDGAHREVTGWKGETR